MNLDFEHNGITIEFYQKPNDEKFSFRIKDDEKLTELLLNSVKTKRVKYEDLDYAIKGIFNKIKEIKNNQIEPKNESIMNPIVKLSELCQKKFKESLMTRVVNKIGADHNPVIEVEIILPDGKVYTGYGSNQKIAKQKAAKDALNDIES